jgi:hypothetical protein
MWQRCPLGGAGPVRVIGLDLTSEGLAGVEMGVYPRRRRTLDRHGGNVDAGGVHVISNPDVDYMEP